MSNTATGWDLPSERDPNLTKYEEAKQCPRCGIPGQVVSNTPAGPAAKRGTRVEMVFCRNQACVWADTSWVIQINPDGSIPERGQGGDKMFPALKDGPELERRVIAATERQLELELRGDAELRNPFSRGGY